MKPSSELTSRADYVAQLKRLLPPEAFAPARSKLWQVTAHLLILGLSYFAIREIHFVAVRILASIVIGHSLTCLVFLAHELSHGAILRRGGLRYPLEVVLWGLNLIPATMWQKLHNQNHHVHANTLHDPDRFFRKCEFEAPGGFLRRWYTRFFFPHRLTSRWNPGVGFHFMTYIVRHLAAVFYPGDKRPAVVTFKPAYSPSERLKVFSELVVIVAMQYGIFLAVGSSWMAWIWASPIALLITSTIAMSYIWTNHYLHDLHEIHDPLAGSTSVEVYPVFDKLHNNFSYHTEHHLFPGMNSDFYPLVCNLLKQHFADQYHRLRYCEAWRRLWQGETYIRESPAENHSEENCEPAAAQSVLSSEANGSGTIGLI